MHPTSTSSIPVLLSVYFEHNLKLTFTLGGIPLEMEDVFYGNGLFPAICHVAKVYCKDTFGMDIHFDESAGRGDFFTHINLNSFDPVPAVLVLMVMRQAAVSLLGVERTPIGSSVEIRDTVERISEIYRAKGAS